jgi:hypothetical protein
MTDPVSVSENAAEIYPPEPLIKYGWLRAILIIPIWLLAAIVVSIVVAVATGATRGEDLTDQMGNATGMLVQMVQMLVFVVPAFVFRKLIERRSVVSLGYSFGNGFGRDFLWGILGGIILISAIFFTIRLAGGLSIVSIQAPGISFLVVTVTWLFVGIGEETAVRGYLLSNCMDSMNKYVALLITSLAFSALHLLNPNPSAMGMINIILAGILLGIYYVHKRNLWFPIGLHWTWNLFQGSFFGSEVSGVQVDSVVVINATGSDLLTGGRFGFEASIVTTFVMIAAIIALHLIYRPRPSSVPTPSAA